MSGDLARFAAFIERLEAEATAAQAASETAAKEATSAEKRHLPDPEPGRTCPTDAPPSAAGDSLGLLRPKALAQDSASRKPLPSAPLDPPWPHQPNVLLRRLTAALMIARPWMHITDPERARGYFEARARHMLATTTGDLLAFVEREERTAVAQPKRDQAERKPEATRRG
jgi:hypothetical protein